MTFVRIFGRWFVHAKDRAGVQPEEDGRWHLCLENAPRGCMLRVNGKLQELADGSVDVRMGSEETSLMLLYPDGTEERVEKLCVANAKLFPYPLNVDELILTIADRVQRLEARVDQEEVDIEKINKKGRGALYLGGAKQ